MNFNNKGNIKIASLILSLVGITTFFVTQGTSIQNQPNAILGGFSGLEKNYNEVKTKVIDEPLSFVEDSKRKVEELQILQTESIQSPKNVLSENSQINSTYTQPSKSVINTLPETKITKLTSQMVENCKIITDEYNKLKEGNQ